MIKILLVLKAAGNINSGYERPNPKDYDFSKYIGVQNTMCLSVHNLMIRLM